MISSKDFYEPKRLNLKMTLMLTRFSTSSVSKYFLTAPCTKKNQLSFEVRYPGPLTITSLN